MARSEPHPASRILARASTESHWSASAKRDCSTDADFMGANASPIYAPFEDKSAQQTRKEQKEDRVSLFSGFWRMTGWSLKNDPTTYLRMRTNSPALIAIRTALVRAALLHEGRAVQPRFSANGWVKIFAGMKFLRLFAVLWLVAVSPAAMA